MINSLWFLWKQICRRQEGQDLTEYALTFAVISLGCVASLQFLASGLNTVFSVVGQSVTQNIS